MIGTVHRDLGSLSTMEKLKHAKTAINPKGVGEKCMTTFSIVFVATFVALQVVIAVILRLSGVFGT
jgi:hypothetical protein